MRWLMESDAGGIVLLVALAVCLLTVPVVEGSRYAWRVVSTWNAAARLAAGEVGGG